MSNPFQFFAEDDDETFQPASTTEAKVKRTHQEKRLFKQQKATVKGAQVSAPAFTESAPERVKENAKQIRNNRAPPTPGTKKIGEGHYHDRRSGTGRDDRPRKEGGGKGNIGNVKDELNPDRYIKQTNEQNQPQGEVPPVEGDKPQQPVKPEEPEKLTLEEYYKNKGIEINNTYEQKAPVKKADINAEWIKKEKLIVLETKEEKKNNERNTQGFVKFSDSKSGLDESLGGLGFGQKLHKKHTEQKRDAKPEHRGGKGKGKAVINQQDFPSL